MITQEATFHENYNIKTSSEYNEGVLVVYKEYNEQGQIVFENVIGEYEKKIEYDKKHRLVRWSSIDATRNKSWKTFSYSKDKMTILHRREGNPAIIHKMVFGPKEVKSVLLVTPDLSTMLLMK